MPFTLNNAPGKVGHLNIRKEGPDDEKALAIDIKIKARAPASVLTHLVGDEPQALEFISGLWDSSGNLRVFSLHEIGFECSFANHSIKIANGIRLEDATLKKFKFKPRDGMDIDLEFSVTVKPQREVVSMLSEYVQEEVDISVEPGEPQLDLQGGGRPAAKTAPEARAEAQAPLALPTPPARLISPAEFDEAQQEEDPLYPAAVKLVLTSRRASIAYLQRQLTLGYNRAARLIERMEAEGLVSAPRPDGTRQVLAPAPEIEVVDAEFEEAAEGDTAGNDDVPFRAAE